MAQGFLARVAGKTKQIIATVVSAGAADAGKVVALDDSGRLDQSLLPTGVGANTVSVVASEAIGAGKFVDLWLDAGVLKTRLADNSNQRPAWGYVKTAVALAGTATVYRLNTVNSALSGLVAGSDYWLGTAGGVTDTPLDPDASSGLMDQYLGKASSETELVTVEHAPVYL